jgi:hypothetical protein
MEHTGRKTEFMQNIRTYAIDHKITAPSQNIDDDVDG